MSGPYRDQDDEELDADDADLAHEGIHAFNQLASAVDGLGSRLATLDTALGSKVGAAERVAASAATAAQGAKEAATQAHAAAREERRSLALWMAGVVAVAVFGAGLVGYELGQRAGEAVGRADGYQAAQDEKAAASWANTPTGQLALTLDRAGSIATLARCANQGWKIEKQLIGRVCLPYRAQDAQYGWVLP